MSDSSRKSAGATLVVLASLVLVGAVWWGWFAPVRVEGVRCGSGLDPAIDLPDDVSCSDARDSRALGMVAVAVVAGSLVLLGVNITHRAHRAGTERTDPADRRTTSPARGGSSTAEVVERVAHV